MRKGFFDRFSSLISRGVGRAESFALACGLIVLWAITGPLFGFSETWQLVVNTATTIVTFLMVFVLQHSQNKDGEAVQAKLDDLIFAISKADNRLIGAENLTAAELQSLRGMITAEIAKADNALVADRPQNEVTENRGRQQS